MKRILLKISYDGTSYHGWQVQPNGITVQQTLQEGLQKILGSRPNITGCSRTDAGVHAREFYCHFDCDERIPDKAFLLGLNSVLPDDIAVIGCREVAGDFHARYNALGKTYTYRMYCGAPNPFLGRYALKISRMPDVKAMNEFCKTIIGTHDFYGFSSSGRTVEDTVRSVSEANVIADDCELQLNITANGFLYNMVRILAGTALEVGEGRLQNNCALAVFDTKDRSFAGRTLPAKGLTLEKVYYD